MQRYIALLGGINVGGHRVKMAHLRALFEALGFEQVETLIASGNVIFETPVSDTAALETQSNSISTRLWATKCPPLSVRQKN